MKSKNIIPFSGIAVLAIALASSAYAAVLYSDDFTGRTAGDSLTGTSPTTAPASETWSGSTAGNVTRFEYDGAGRAMVIQGTTSGDPNSAAVHLPISLVGSMSYTVSATVYNPLAGTDGNWIAMGFTDTSSTSTIGSSYSFSGYVDPGRMWTLWRGSDGLASFAGPRVDNALNNTLTAAGESNTLDLRTILDFTAGSFGEASFEYKDPTAGSWTTIDTLTFDSTTRDALLNNVNFVGFSASKAGVGVSQFEVSVIPEPSSVLLGGLGLLALLRRRR